MILAPNNHKDGSALYKCTQTMRQRARLILISFGNMENYKSSILNKMKLAAVEEVYVD